MLLDQLATLLAD